MQYFWANLPPTQETECMGGKLLEYHDLILVGLLLCSKLKPFC